MGAGLNTSAATLSTLMLQQKALAGLMADASSLGGTASLPVVKSQLGETIVDPAAGNATGGARAGFSIGGAPVIVGSVTSDARHESTRTGCVTNLRAPEGVFFGVGRPNDDRGATRKLNVPRFDPETGGVWTNFALRKFLHKNKYMTKAEATDFTLFSVARPDGNGAFAGQHMPRHGGGANVDLDQPHRPAPCVTTDLDAAGPANDVDRLPVLAPIFVTPVAPAAEHRTGPTAGSWNAVAGTWSAPIPQDANHHFHSTHTWGRRGGGADVFVTPLGDFSPTTVRQDETPHAASVILGNSEGLPVLGWVNTNANHPTNQKPQWEMGHADCACQWDHDYELNAADSAGSDHGGLLDAADPSRGYHSNPCVRENMVLADLTTLAEGATNRHFDGPNYVGTLNGRDVIFFRVATMHFQNRAALHPEGAGLFSTTLASGPMEVDGSEGRAPVLHCGELLGSNADTTGANLMMASLACSVAMVTALTQAMIDSMHRVAGLRAGS